MNYSFANVRYVDDRFGAFRSQASLSTGIGWRTIQTERSKLNMEAGVGYRYSEANKTGVESNEAVFRGKGRWEYRLTENTRLVEDFRVEAGC